VFSFSLSLLSLLTGSEWNVCACVLVNEAGKGVVLCVLLWCRNEKVVEGEEKNEEERKTNNSEMQFVFLFSSERQFAFLFCVQESKLFFSGRERNNQQQR